MAAWSLRTVVVHDRSVSDESYPVLHGQRSEMRDIRHQSDLKEDISVWGLVIG